jgi:hypothetical protein
MEPVEEEKNTSEFHPLVTIMLARMKSNPQEFLRGNLRDTPSPKKSHVQLVELASQFMTAAERTAVKAGMREANMQLLHEHFLKSLLIRETK